MEDLAQDWEQFEQRYGAALEAWELPAMKLFYAETYRRLIGVRPDQRDELRAQLLRVCGQLPSNRPHHANGGASPRSADDVFA